MIRFFDIIFSVFGIIILSPFLILFIIWIKLDSPGPFFFKQVRVGKNNKDFFLYKFRSMRIDSERTGYLTVGNKDSRITKAGYFLRKHKLDELPQLLNILKGEMSVVGPRPEVRKYVNHYNTEQLIVLSVEPGLTDMASIIYSNENEILLQYEDPEKAYIQTIMPEKIRINIDYIQNRSLKNYFRIIFLTIKRIWL